MLALRLACHLGHVRIGVSPSIASKIGGASRVVPAYISPVPEDEELPEELAQWLAARSSVGRRTICMCASRVAKIDGVDLYGFDMLIDAFDNSEVRRGYSAIVCVSQMGPDESYFRNLLGRLSERDIQEQVKLVVGDISLPGVLRRCDIFVRPTITDGDAISIREALAYGVPAIASDAEVRPEPTVVFAARDVDQFVQCILDAPKVSQSRADQRDFSDEIIRIYEALA